MEFAGRRPTGMVLVDPEGFLTDKALTAWVQRGVDFASTLPGKKLAGKKSRHKEARG